MSEGGLFVGLLEKGRVNGLGLISRFLLSSVRTQFSLVRVSRILVTVSEENKDKFIDLMMLNGCAFDLLGHVTKEAFELMTRLGVGKRLPKDLRQRFGRYPFEKGTLNSFISIFTGLWRPFSLVETKSSVHYGLRSFVYVRFV